MPKYRVETSDGTFEIESDREPTPSDVESYLRQSQALPSNEAPALPPVAAKPAPAPKSENQALFENMRERGWEKLDPQERMFYLLAKSLPESFGIVAGAAPGLAARSIGPAVGQKIGRLLPVPGGERIGGAIGGAGGEIVAEVMEGGTEFRPGAIAGAAVSGAVTGKPMARMGGAELAKEGARIAGSNVASAATETAIDAERLPTLGEAGRAAASGVVGAGISRALARPKSIGGRPAISQMENETLQSLRKEGAIIPPHEIGAGSDTLASIGGKAALQQEASKRNQFVWQKLAREDIGLSKESLPIRPSELVARREQLGAPYREIQKFQSDAADELESRLAAIAKESDPHTAQIKLDEPQTKAALDRLRILAAADVDELKVARDQANSARKSFYAGNPNAYDAWQAARAKAESIEDAIEKAADTIGDSTLMKRLKDSRQQIAKTYSVEESLNLGNGFVDPITFGRQLANGDKMSGNLEKIAKFQLAFRREAVEASRVPASGVGAMGAMSATNMASRGDAPGLIGAAVQMTAGRAVRPYLLSDYVQEGMLNPREVQNFSSALARYISENAAELSRPEPVAP